MPMSLVRGGERKQRQCSGAVGCWRGGGVGGRAVHSCASTPSSESRTASTCLCARKLSTKRRIPWNPLTD
eukprot:scaffold2042_cov175-Ochromonas_danica.AAC.2